MKDKIKFLGKQKWKELVTNRYTMNRGIIQKERKSSSQKHKNVYWNKEQHKQ